jgi:hypothetical protein
VTLWTGYRQSSAECLSAPPPPLQATLFAQAEITCAGPRMTPHAWSWHIMHGRDMRSAAVLAKHHCIEVLRALVRSIARGSCAHIFHAAPVDAYQAAPCCPLQRSPRSYSRMLLPSRIFSKLTDGVGDVELVYTQDSRLLFSEGVLLLVRCAALMSVLAQLWCQSWRSSDVGPVHSMCGCHTPRCCVSEAQCMLMQRSVCSCSISKCSLYRCAHRHA